MRQATRGSNPAKISALQGTGKGHVRLNKDHFTLLCNVLGHTTREAQATFLSVGWRTVQRIISGSTCSGMVISQTLAAFERHENLFRELGLPITFEALFTADAETGTSA